MFSQRVNLISARLSYRVTNSPVALNQKYALLSIEDVWIIINAKYICFFFYFFVSCLFPFFGKPSSVALNQHYAILSIEDVWIKCQIDGFFIWFLRFLFISIICQNKFCARLFVTDAKSTVNIFPFRCYCVAKNGTQIDGFSANIWEAQHQTCRE